MACRLIFLHEVFLLWKMKRTMSSHSHRDERSRTSRCGSDFETGLRSKTEEERLRRRREWMIEQEKLREHEKLKAKMILEYEIRRAREKGLPPPKGRFLHHSRSKSKSKSPESQHRTTSSSTSKTAILSKKLEPSDGTTPLFKGPEGTQVSIVELRSIKVDIHRNVPGKTTTDELQRAIVNPEDVQVMRREGEGSRPIFEREEIKSATVKTKEIVEHRTVVAINNENLENKSGVYKKYTTSRSQSCSPQRRLSHYTRYEDSKRDGRNSYRNDRERDRSRGRSREYKEKDRRHGQLHTTREERKGHRDHSRSREREQRTWNRESHKSFKDERSHRERSRDRSRVTSSHYIEQIPVPFYYGDFPARPIMVGPLVPIRGQVPLGPRHMMGPLRPFPPRFIPPDMYRLRPPPNPRFGPIY